MSRRALAMLVLMALTVCFLGGTWSGIVLAQYRYQWCAEALEGRPVSQKWQVCRSETRNSLNREEPDALWLDIADQVARVLP